MCATKASMEYRLLSANRPYPAFFWSLGSQDRHNWFWQVNRNETELESTCLYNIQFWFYTILAQRENLGNLAFFFLLSCKDPYSPVGRFNSWLWDANAAIKNRQGKSNFVDLHSYWGVPLPECGARTVLEWEGLPYRLLIMMVLNTSG